MDPHIKDGQYFPDVKPSPEGKHTNHLQTLLKITKSLRGKSKFSAFHHPVNVVDLEIPEYFEMVKTPMDLGTIQRRLENLHYTQASECIEDYRLMFTNCYIYNDENCVKICKDLEALFNKETLQLVPPEVELQPTSPASKEIEDPGTPSKPEKDDSPVKTPLTRSLAKKIKEASIQENIQTTINDDLNSSDQAKVSEVVIQDNLEDSYKESFKAEDLDGEKENHNDENLASSILKPVDSNTKIDESKPPVQIKRITLPRASKIIKLKEVLAKTFKSNEAKEENKTLAASASLKEKENSMQGNLNSPQSNTTNKENTTEKPACKKRKVLDENSTKEGVSKPSKKKKVEPQALKPNTKPSVTQSNRQNKPGSKVDSTSNNRSVTNPPEDLSTDDSFSSSSSDEDGNDTSLMDDDAEESNNTQLMGEDEVHYLNEAIVKLRKEHIKRIVKIIKKREPTALTETKKTLISYELDLQCASPSLRRKMVSIIKKYSA